MELLLFDDEPAAKHAHGTGEWELAGLLGHELDRDERAGRQLGALIEVLEHHLIGTRRRLFTAEVETHGLAPAVASGVGRVTALHQDHRSAEHTSEHQSLMRRSDAALYLTKQKRSHILA